jgi:hypothetical protein
MALCNAMIALRPFCPLWIFIERTPDSFDVRPWPVPFRRCSSAKTFGRFAGLQEPPHDF